MTLFPALAGGREIALAPTVAPSHVGAHPIDFVLMAPAVLNSHSSVVFMTSLINKADIPTVLYLAKPFIPDVVVFDQKGTPVWNCLNGESIRTIAAPYALKGREQKVFTCEWRVVSNGGERLPPGRYTAESWLHTDDVTVKFLLKSQKVQIVVR